MRCPKLIVCPKVTTVNVLPRILVNGLLPKQEVTVTGHITDDKGIKVRIIITADMKDHNLNKLSKKLIYRYDL